jgi:hypothetical protein
MIAMMMRRGMPMLASFSMPPRMPRLRTRKFIAAVAMKKKYAHSIPLN